MIFNDHSRIKGQHAMLSPSSYHWLNYDEEKLIQVYRNLKAKERGTKLHAFAEDAIRLGIKLPRTKQTLQMYVNDAIGYNLQPEVPLYFSDHCFGTTDAIDFRHNLLRISDLKTGVTKASMDQLLVYMALFCLEYGYDPHDFDAELRIYPNDSIEIKEPEIDEIMPVIDKIIASDKVLTKLDAEES